MDFAIDILFVQQSLGAGTPQLAQHGSGRAGDDWKHATGPEFLPGKAPCGFQLRRVRDFLQVTLQRLTHDILEAQPPEGGLRLRVPEQMIRDIDGGPHNGAS